MKQLWVLALAAVLMCGCFSDDASDDVPVNVTDVDLAKAITKGDTATVTAILDENPQLINLPNAVGETPLHYAARANNPEMIQLLLQRGAVPTVRNDAEETPADVAAASGAAPEVLQLLTGGAQGY